MIGARKFAGLFKTGQHGRLYLVSSRHARGTTFRIYVLPAGVEAIPNSDVNPPLNSDAVEVYGVVSGNPGWTETYGWLHEGKWQADFAELVAQREAELAAAESTTQDAESLRREREDKKRAELLATY